MKPAIRIGIGVLAIVTLVLAHEGHKAISTKGVSFGPKTSHLLMEPLAKKAVGLATSKVDFATIEEKLSTPARVTLPWTRQGFASARIAGIVESVRGKPGDLVRAGDTLAEVSSLELDSLQLDLTQRHLDKRQLEENLRRARELGERVVAGRDVMELEVDVQDRENEIQILRQQLEMLGLTAAQLDALVEKGESVRLLPITAPVAGYVAHVDVEIGAHVEPDRHLIEIHDLTAIWVEGEVPESRVGAVREGMTARMTFAGWPERVFEGTVRMVGAQVSEATRTVRVWVDVANPDGVLKPGQFGRMDIVIGVSENAVAAPITSVVEDGAERYAVVQEKPDTWVRVNAKDQIEEYSAQAKEGFVRVSTYAKKNVVTGRSDASLVEILDGIYPGDIVVTDASHELSALYVQGTLKLSDEARRNIRLETEEVDLRSVDDIVRLNAVLRVPVGREAVVSTRIEGKVLAIRAVPGQAVKAGEVLAELHSVESERLQLEFRRSTLRERLVRTLLEQIQPLGKSGIAPRKELLRLESEHRTQLSAALSMRRRLRVLGMADAQLDALAEKGDYSRALPIVAPIDGRVTDVNVVIGQVVGSDDALFRIANAGLLWAEARVFETDFGKVLGGDAKKDAVLRLVSFPGREWKAPIAFAGRSVAYEQKVLPLFAEIAAGEDGLRPGMIGELLVVVGRPDKKVIAAPNRALLTIGGRTFAFVGVGKSFKRVPVETGRRDAHYTEVVKGLFPGDKVAVSGVNELNTAIMSLK